MNFLTNTPNPQQHWWHVKKIVALFFLFQFYQFGTPKVPNCEALEMPEFFAIWCPSWGKRSATLAHITMFSTYLLWEHSPHCFLWRTLWELRDIVFGISLLYCFPRKFLQPPGICDVLYHFFQWKGSPEFETLGRVYLQASLLHHKDCFHSFFTLPVPTEHQKLTAARQIFTSSCEYSSSSFPLSLSPVLRRYMFFWGFPHGFLPIDSSLFFQTQTNEFYKSLGGGSL